jgi:hypothetical protein
MEQAQQLSLQPAAPAQPKHSLCYPPTVAENKQNCSFAKRTPAFVPSAQAPDTPNHRTTTAQPLTQDQPP